MTVYSRDSILQTGIALRVYIMWLGGFDYNIHQVVWGDRLAGVFVKDGVR